MKEIITVNILLIFLLPMYITYTRFGSIEFGEFYCSVAILFTVASLFYTAIKLSSIDDDSVM